MYEYINGTIAELTPAYAVVDCAGVGYFLNISLHTYAALENLPQARLYVQYIVREDAQILYGFFTKEEREIFRLLTSVSGVGVATARMALSTYSPQELIRIISTENDLLLKNVKGMGLKTAQKIIVELKGKITGAAASTTVGVTGGILPGARSEVAGEALSALSMLGFPKAASEKTVASILKDNPAVTVEELVRLSLKKL